MEKPLVIGILFVLFGIVLCGAVLFGAGLTIGYTYLTERAHSSQASSPELAPQEPMVQETPQPVQVPPHEHEPVQVAAEEKEPEVKPEPGTTAPENPHIQLSPYAFNQDVQSFMNQAAQTPYPVPTVPYISAASYGYPRTPMGPFFKPESRSYRGYYRPYHYPYPSFSYQHLRNRNRYYRTYSHYDPYYYNRHPYRTHYAH